MSAAANNDVAKRWGLEIAIAKEGFDVHIAKKKDKAAGVTTARALLQEYGPAYLLTSISLTAVSYTICYVGISRGVNVAAALQRVGLNSGAASSKVGKASIAYVCHKAASPLRFPPTVALTPVVARMLSRSSS